MKMKIIDELNKSLPAHFSNDELVEMGLDKDREVIRLGAEMSQLPVASTLLKQAIDGNGDFQYYENDSIVASGFKDSFHFKTQLLELKNKIPPGGGMVMSGFVDFNKPYKGVSPTKDQHLSYGIVKTALLVRHNEDGSMSYKGAIGDAYNFEAHEFKYDGSLSIYKNTYRLGVVIINNIAVIEQILGNIKPFGWQASVEGSI